MQIGEHLKEYTSKPKIEFGKPIVIPKGGIVGPIVEIRTLTAKMLGKSIGQVSKLTEGWSHQRLYSLYQMCQRFKQNPGALWWKEYEKIKQYEKDTKKINTRRLCKLGKKVGRKEQEKRQQVLF